MDRRELLRSTVVGVGAGAAATALSPSVASAAPGTTGPTRGPLRAHILMFPGVEEADFIALIEVFGLARALGADITTTLVTGDTPGPVTATYGTTVEVAGRWSPRDANLILVPGGGYRRPDAPGVAYEIRRGHLPRLLAAAPRRGLTLAAVCTGTMLLSAAGLTAGRPCITHRGAVEDLRAQGGVITEARVVDDGDLVTAGGITSGFDLALWLVERYAGAAIAVRAEQVLEYERRGTVWQR